MTHEFDYTVDGEDYETDDKKKTANEILQSAGLNPAEYYLVEIDGKKQHSYQDHGGDTINLKKKQKFVSVFTGPTTVSHGPLSGAVLFIEQMKQLGYEAIELSDGAVTFQYEVEVGKYAGQTFQHALALTPFPAEPPSGPHIKAQLHPIQSGGVHPTGGIHASPSFGEGWQYWSRPFPNWQGSKKNAAAYLAFLRNLWATQ